MSDKLSHHRKNLLRDLAQRLTPLGTDYKEFVFKELERIHTFSKNSTEYSITGEAELKYRLRRLHYSLYNALNGRPYQHSERTSAADKHSFDCLEQAITSYIKAPLDEKTRFVRVASARPINFRKLKHDRDYTRDF